MNSPLNLPDINIPENSRVSFTLEEFELWNSRQCLLNLTPELRERLRNDPLRKPAGDRFKLSQ
ncbi:MAG: hypothetical protein ACYTFY_22410 [Planctomycetota bacterium]|jgi:hypothetical protein